MLKKLYKYMEKCFNRNESKMVYIVTIKVEHYFNTGSPVLTRFESTLIDRVYEDEEKAIQRVNENNELFKKDNEIFFNENKPVREKVTSYMIKKCIVK